MVAYPVLEHRAGRWAWWLRERRLRLALLLSAFEVVLIATRAVPWTAGLALAALVLVVSVSAGRRARHPAVRELAWIGAVAQIAPLVVPLVVAVAATIVVAAVALLVLFLLVLVVLAAARR